MKKVIRKNMLGLSSYLLLELVLIRGASHIVIERLEVIDVVIVLGGIVILGLIIRAIFTPYIVVTGILLSPGHHSGQQQFLQKNHYCELSSRTFLFSWSIFFIVFPATR